MILRRYDIHFVWGHYEHELPADMTDQDRKAWFRQSQIFDGFRIGPGLIRRMDAYENGKPIDADGDGQ